LIPTEYTITTANMLLYATTNARIVTNYLQQKSLHLSHGLHHTCTSRCISLGWFNDSFTSGLYQCGSGLGI